MRYLLIHGSWHGAWCWHKVVSCLETQNHQVIAIDLLGRGRSPAKAPFVGLSRMVEHAAKHLSDEEQTTIVVHSRYGVLASQLAERAPSKIARTIYLASFMLPNGKSIVDYFRSDKQSKIQPFVDVNRMGMWDWLRPEGYRDVLYHDCSEDDNRLAASLLCREPLRPAIGKLRLTDGKYESVPRGYIRLSKDRAVSIELQDRLLNETLVDHVETIDAGHSAYFCKPDELTDAILKISGN